MIEDGATVGAWLEHADVVDLTLPIAEDLPSYWPTHMPFQHKTWNWFTDGGGPEGRVYNRTGPYSTRWFAIDEHTGTHFDAPVHFVPPAGSGLPDAGPAGSITAEQVPLSQLTGPAAVIDVTALTGTVAEPAVSPLIEPDVILDWERRHGPLRARDVVLFHSGWDRHYLRGDAGRPYLRDVVETASGPAWPAPSVAAIDLLVERGVRCAGTDGPSMGPAHGDLGRAVHVRALRTGAVFVECLTGLDRLPARGAWFCFLPLKIEGGTGAPGRAAAWIPAAATP